jgi:hypothetical protein
VEGVEEVGGGGVGDVVGVGLEVDLDRAVGGAQEEVDERQVADELGACVVGDDDDRLGLLLGEVGPGRGCVVDEQLGCFGRVMRSSRRP